MTVHLFKKIKKTLIPYLWKLATEQNQQSQQRTQGDASHPRMSSLNIASNELSFFSVQNSLKVP